MFWHRSFFLGEMPRFFLETDPGPFSAICSEGDSSESEFLIIDLYLTGCTIKTYRGLEAELLGV